MPIAQIMIFGYVVKNDIKDVKIAVYDKSKDNVTREITDKILSSGYFLLSEKIDSNTELERIFKKGEVKEIIVFEPDFAKRLENTNTANIQLIADASDANTANLIVNYTQAIIYEYVKSINANNSLAVQIVPEARMMYNEEMKSVYMFVPGTMALILLLISAMMTSISIAREKEMGTMEILLVSPLQPLQIIMGKVMPYIILSLVNAISIILLGFFVFDVPIHGSIILLMFETMLFIFLALSIGIFISTVSKSQQTAMFISIFSLMLPTILLSGFIFPIKNMPLVLQWFCNIVPPKWFIIIIKDIMLKGTGFMYVWKETLILLGMIIFFISLSVKKFKVRLE